MAETINDEKHLARTLAALASYLTEPLLDRAQTALGLQDEGSRAMAIASLVPVLAEPQRRAMIDEALRASQMLSDVSVLDALAPHLTQAHLPTALYVAQSLQDSDFPMALRTLVSNCRHTYSTRLSVP